MNSIVTEVEEIFNQTLNMSNIQILKHHKYFNI